MGKLTWFISLMVLIPLALGVLILMGWRFGGPTLKVEEAPPAHQIFEAENREFKAVYSTTMTTDNQTVQGELTLAVKGEKMAVQTSLGDVGTFLYIYDGEDHFSCFRPLGGNWSCAEGKAALKEFGEVTEKADLLEPVEVRNYLGEDCYLYSYQETTGEASSEVEVCVTPDGVILYWRVTAQQGGTFSEVVAEATSVERQVSESEFVPPAQPP